MPGPGPRSMRGMDDIVRGNPSIPPTLPPTPYTFRDMLVRLTEAVEKHTQADDEWRETVLTLFQQRLKEKETMLKMMAEQYKRNDASHEADKKRWFRTTIVCIAIMASFAGVKIAELAGLLAGF